MQGELESNKREKEGGGMEMKMKWEEWVVFGFYSSLVNQTSDGGFGSVE